MDWTRRVLAHSAPTRCLAAVLALALVSLLAPSTALAYGNGGSDDCPFDESWLEGAEPSLPLTVVSRNNDPSGPDKCDFYRFAWQYFLYLVQPENNDTVFETWPPVDTIFPADPAPCPGAHVPVVNKFNETDQAGSAAQLYDRQGNLVYYQLQVNPQYECTINACQLTNYGCVKDAEASPLEGGFALPVDTVELKTSWRQLPSSLDDIAQYFYTTEAALAPLPPATQCKEDIRIGLVGFHLVVKTLNHPEFLWFTFEQVDNAPTCDPNGCGGNPANCNVPANTQGPNGFWSFADNSGGPFNATEAPTGTDPADVCEAYAQGDNACLDLDCSNSDCQNRCFITSINTQASAALEGNVWDNYTLMGGIWTNNGDLEFDGNTLLNQRGSLMIANTTMETYTQDDNCFNCHAPRPAKEGKTGQILFSHLFGSAFVPQTTDTCPITIDNSCYQSCLDYQTAEIEPVASHTQTR